LPDASGNALHRAKLALDGPAARRLPAPLIRLLTAARGARMPVMLSHDAGRYLCNYLCWRAAETAAKPGGPRFAAFVHVPQVRQVPRPRGAKSRFSLDELARAGTRLLLTMSAAVRR